ncbi:phosphoribosylglycinamide formyltransferase [Proteiniphilum propionicum]|nr:MULTISPECIES: phosphoribosylglycinamide formyltransferase [Proteiniphilum]ULB34996.1 phosphoribosylglycinamide formyltransferase [Proteiniphilum propionicum]
MTRISIFASGNGSNAENIVRYFSDSDDIVVSLIISNKRDAYVHERARHLGIPSFTFSKPEFDDGLLVLDTLREYNIDFIVLAGFLLKLSQPLLDSYPERIVNIHPALLPRHGGKGMYGDRVHRAVVDSGDKESGITIHYVNENYDEGSIIYQATCEVNKEDTPDDIARKVHVLEYTHYPRVVEEVVKKIASGESQIKK